MLVYKCSLFAFLPVGLFPLLHVVWYVLYQPTLLLLFASLHTGEKWSSFESRRDNNPDIAKRFARQEQLVSYFIAELDMLAKLCFGRSYNAIKTLQVNFSYSMLISVIKNEHLPCLVRAAGLNLCRVIYVDR
jgi:hypothetical protein